MIEFSAISSSSKGNAYLVTDGHTPLLLECGIRFADIRKACDFKASLLAGCLISHEHGDHAMALKDVLKAGVDCYMSLGTSAAVLCGEPSSNPISHRIKIIKARHSFKLGTWTILPFDTVHDAAEPLGFLLASGGEKLLFATDTAYLKYRFNGLSIIALECNHQLEILRQNVESGSVPYPVKNRILKSHLNLDNVLSCLESNDLSTVREIWLLHLSDGNSDAEAMKKAVQMASGKPVYIA